MTSQGRNKYHCLGFLFLSLCGILPHSKVKTVKLMRLPSRNILTKVNFTQLKFLDYQKNVLSID